MVEIFGVQIDTSKMTEEELEKIRKEARNLIAQVDFEICCRKKAKHIYKN